MAHHLVHKPGATGAQDGAKTPSLDSLIPCKLYRAHHSVHKPGATGSQDGAKTPSSSPINCIWATIRFTNRGQPGTTLTLHNTPIHETSRPQGPKLHHDASPDRTNKSYHQYNITTNIQYPTQPHQREFSEGSAAEESAFE